MASAIFNCFSIPFKVAFEPEEMNKNYFSVMNSFIDLVFLIDILVNFRTTFMDEKGEEIKDPRRIAINYLRLHFWIDLVATLPLAEIISSLSRKDDSRFELFGILKLGRLLKLKKII